MKTDSQLHNDVIAALEWEPSVDAAQIGVAVKDGVVTLFGEVSSAAEKWNAECAALRVAGVSALAVEMQVKLSELGRRSDPDIAGSAEHVLQWMTSLPPDAVKVMVEAGRITLSGEVDWQYQKQAACDAVRGLVGVTGVSDEIGIVDKASSGVVKTDIDAALKRRARADAQAISVAVEGAAVTLTGTVDSWAERRLAIESAWGAPGVRAVVDKLTVVA